MILPRARSSRAPARPPAPPPAPARPAPRARTAGLALAAAALLVAGGGAARADEAGTADAPARFLERESVREWIRQTSAERGLDRNRVSGLFARLESRPAILDAIARPAERTLTWREYRPIFLGEERVRAGRAYLEEHRETFARASARYGVPAKVIAAIIGVETLYGRITGRHGVLESLATLAFDYPPRAPFFAAELAEFLVLADAEGWDALGIKGSYAGAMGLPQFISSSYRRYAIDFDGDGRRDLFANPADVIGSVANYLAEHGWRAGEPLAERWRPAAERREAARALVRDALEPSVAPARVRRLGFEPAGETAEARAPLSVMTFAGAGGEEFWVGYTNFYAITRYNHSRLYALAVHQLAEAIDGER